VPVLVQTHRVLPRCVFSAPREVTLHTPIPAPRDGLGLERVALVTGSGRGIGREVALSLARGGHAVAVNDLVHFNYAEQLAGEIRALGGHAAAFCADVSNAREVVKMLADIKGALGPVTVLVNNAALTEGHKPWTEISGADWDRVMAVNVKSCFLTVRSVYPDMQHERWGRIINFSSVVAHVGVRNLLDYSTSKAAIIGFTRSLAREVATDGITVNAIAPGAIHGEAEEAVVSDPQAADREALAQQAIQRRGVAADLTGIVSFLVSDDASFITGQTVGVDGGWAMH
jgi:NAD(P)-dependent dehydrogenase (short-subunit alcohol dehydrogenase family)